MQNLTLAMLTIAIDTPAPIRQNAESSVAAIVGDCN